MTGPIDLDAKRQERDLEELTDEERITKAREDAEAQDAAGAVEGPAEPAALPTGFSVLLEARGYINIRSTVLGTCQAIGQLGLEPITEGIGYVERAMGKARLQGADAAALDAMDNELRAFKACQHLWKQLRANDEAAQARASLRGDGPLPPTG